MQEIYDITVRKGTSVLGPTFAQNAYRWKASFPCMSQLLLYTLALSLYRFGKRLRIPPWLGKMGLVLCCGFL